MGAMDHRNDGEYFCAEFLRAETAIPTGSESYDHGVLSGLESAADRIDCDMGYAL